MSTVLTPPGTAENLAELVERLGNIPLYRIRTQPPPGMATEADALASLQQGRRLFELVDGVLVEKGMGYSESLLASLLITLLNEFVRPRNLGMVTGESGTFRLFPGLLRIPDVAFTSWDRTPGRRRPTQPVPHLAPDLAVEVLSASNTPAEMARKRQEYFAAGAVLLWEVDPAARTVTVYTAPGQPAVLGEADTLDGGAVLSGFTLPLRELFAELDRQG
jgi:Uma2 family endonuclease